LSASKDSIKKWMGEIVTSHISDKLVVSRTIKTQVISWFSNGHMETHESVVSIIGIREMHIKSTMECYFTHMVAVMKNRQ
jgi:hypothetical protein